MKSVEQILAERIGLEPESLGRTTLDRAIEKRMASRGLRNIDEYAVELSSSAGEMRSLVDHIIIAETWFFRDPETFDVLREFASSWLARSSPNQELSALSIGCCTGEEPYSIAMALLDLGFPANRLRIDSVDISSRVLNRAAAGVFGSNSFRTADLSFRDRYFRTEKTSYVLADNVKNLVRFSEGNILDETLCEDRQYSVVFCRNVLIYFDNEAQHKAVANLRRLLAPGGLFFAGPAESFMILQNGFTLSDRTRGFSTEPAAPPARQFPAPSLEWKAPPLPKSKPVNKTSFHTPVAVLDTKTERPDLNEAARLANSGQLVEAERICRYHLQTSPSAQAYYLLGLILDAKDHKADAAATYKKALYLDPMHIEALSHLALLLENMGDAASAARFRERMDRAQNRTTK